VAYLRGEGAMLPEPAGSYEDIGIVSTGQLLEVLQKLLIERPFDCIIHAMAVSDYTPYAAMPLDKLALNLDGRVFDDIHQGLRDIFMTQGRVEGKIRSDSDELIIAMRRTPKALDLFKALQPKALLVGFKLFNGGPEAELLGAARAQMEKSGCDYVLANDLSQISGDVHPAVLLDRNGGMRRAGSKQEIASLILKTVTEELIRQ
jgi:phosphopantothenate-cysteine ligase